MSPFPAEPLNTASSGSVSGKWSVPVQPTPEPDTGREVWDESLALAFHDAIDGDYLVGAGGAGNDVGINRVRVSEVVRWATKTILASGWLADRLAEARAEARGVALWEAGAQVGAKRSNPGESADYRRGFKEAIDWAFDSVQSLPRAASIAETAHAARTAPLQDAEEVGE